MGVRVREKVKGSGVWWVFVSVGRRRRSKLVGDKQTAERIARQLRARIAAGQFQLSTAGPTFRELAEEWLAKHPIVDSLSETTRENHASFVRQHLVPFFGAFPVGQITSELVEDFITAKRSPGGSVRFADRALSEGALRNGLVILRMILERAVKAGHLRMNPARGLGRFPRHDEERIDRFTARELQVILAAAQHQDPVFAALVRLWAQTGMRAGEIAALRWGDLDLERGVVVVERSLSRGRIGPTKTRRAREVSFLHPIAEETPEWRPGRSQASRQLLADLRRFPVQALDPEAYVFVKRDGATPWDPMTVLRAWKRALKAADVRYRPPEQLRHTFASTMLSRNAPLLYVQRQGGWQSATVLLRVYARWMPQELDTALPIAPSVHPEPLAAPLPEAVNASEVSALLGREKPLGLDAERGVELAPKGRPGVTPQELTPRPSADRGTTRQALHPPRTRNRDA